eukprot:161746-Hanusia_phi.AAC.1
MIKAGVIDPRGYVTKYVLWLYSSECSNDTCWPVQLGGGWCVQYQYHRALEEGVRVLQAPQ